MNIRNIGGPNPTEMSRHNAANGPDQTSASAQPSTSSKTPVIRDTVEIPGKLPIHRVQRQNVPEVEFAKKALASAPANEQRLSEIKQRLDTGHYSSPEVMAKIADRMVDHLAGSMMMPPDIEF